MCQWLQRRRRSSTRGFRGVKCGLALAAVGLGLGSGLGQGGAHGSAAARADVAAAAVAGFTRITVSPTALVAGQKLTASAAAVDDAGAPAAVTWDFGDGAAAVDGDRAQHTYATPGLFRLTVTAAAATGGGPFATQTFDVVVQPKRAAVTQTAALSDTKAVPFQYVGLFGTFRTDLPTLVEFRFGRTSLLVTPTVVTGNMIRVAAPPLPRGASFAAGSASVHVIQGRGAAAAFTRAGKLKVAGLPRVTLPPGETTKSFIRLARGVLTDARTTLTGSALDTPANADAIESTLAFFDAMTTNVGAPDAKFWRAASASDFEIALSAQTVRQLDGWFAGVIAAGSRNTTDPGMALAYRSWEEATRLAPRQDFDAARLAALVAAEQNYRDRVRLETAALTEGLNSMMAPTTTSIAALGLQGLATGNPAVLAASANLALCSDVLTLGLVLGLSLDAAHAALTQDQLAYETYLGTAGNLAGEFLTGKALGAVADRAAGPLTGDLLGALRDIGGAFGLEVLSLQSLTQPPVAADASLSVSDASAAEGDFGTSDLVFTVRLSAPVAKTVTVKCATGGGTASAGSDYDRIAGTTLRFSPGQTELPVTVRIHGDTTREETETFLVNLSAATGAPIAVGRGTGTIRNDDVAVLTAEHGAGDALGTVTGCGYTTSLSVDGPIRFEVRDAGPGTPAAATITGNTWSSEYGGAYYRWEGDLTWSGDTLSGSLTRMDNPARPAVSVTVTKDAGGVYRLTATVPFTYRLYELDGSCTGPLQTFNHATNALVLQEE